MACKTCYQWKMRWKDGAGTCWFDQTHRHADDPTCEHYTPKAVLVDNRLTASSQSAGVSMDKDSSGGV